MIMFIIIACYLFFFNNSYILSSLIILEMIMLLSMVFMIFSLGVIMESKYLFLLVLTFSACEASMGLSLLVSFMRLRGNNLMMSLSLNSWYAKITWNCFFT
uniref:NADH dehydrogenase subunit 4L n=1 Tax=Bulinus truncatus TaxID=55810 RepID=UPI001EDED433|nr:NADH dehydrogenase subunit 4L [Bulinus truncatus]QYJ56632.1 NADH dehydrogenase subunit 4L [Bulinus truncatus]